MQDIFTTRYATERRKIPFNTHHLVLRLCSIYFTQILRTERINTVALKADNKTQQASCIRRSVKITTKWKGIAILRGAFDHLHLKNIPTHLSFYGKCQRVMSQEIKAAIAKY